MKKATSKFLILASTTCLLTACGGGGTTNGGEIASIPCYDNLLDATNVTYRLSYAGTDASGSFTESVAGEVTPNADLNNHTELLSRTEKVAFIRNDSPTLASWTDISYFQARPHQLPIEYESRAFLQTFQTIVRYEPPYEDNRANLAIGQSETYIARGSRQAGTGDSSAWEPYYRESQVVYVGQENIQVPAGVYRACRYEAKSSDASMTTTWVQRGIVIKSIIGDATRSLTSVQVNGQPLQLLQ